MAYKTYDLSKFSSIRIGPITEVYMIDDFNYPKDHTLIGGANNLLIGPNHPPLMKLSKTFDYIKIENNHLIIGAATPGGKVVSFCKKHNIANFEFMAHLPGTVGGMIEMNAGLKEYEIFNHLISLRFKNHSALREEINYGYRFTDIHEVVFEASFEIREGFKESNIEMFKKMRANQPSNFSAGSFFKNPDGDYAGRLIEAVGLKGHSIGDMAWSEQHANFLINFDQGTFEEAMELVELARSKVFQAFGISLENEVIVLNSKEGT